MREPIDVRGLSCPEPVIRTKAALKKNNSLQVLADSATVVDNITRFAQLAGYMVTSTKAGDDFEISIRK